MNASWTISAARSAASSRLARHIRRNRPAARDAVKGVRATNLLTPGRNTDIRTSSILTKPTPTKLIRTTNLQMHRRNRRKIIANRRIPAKNLIRRRKIISAP